MSGNVLGSEATDVSILSAILLRDWIFHLIERFKERRGKGLVSGVRRGDVFLSSMMVDVLVCGKNLER